MLGEGRAELPDGVVLVRTDEPWGERLTLRAARHLDGLATGRFSTPSASVRFSSASWPAGIELLGFAFTQFAMPVVAAGDLGFDFRPAPALQSPPAVLPLLARAGDRCVLLAPLRHAHEQIVAVRDGELQWGWHGDLDEVPEGFEVQAAVVRGASPSDVLGVWGAALHGAQGVARRPPGTDPLTSHLSYWTDNGAAYWYRTEPGRTIAESVTDVVRALRADGVPVHAVELDSWFYPHEVPRAIREIGYPDDVPPTGMVEWRPRPDAFPPLADADTDPLTRLAHDLDDPPLVLHARHIAPTSPHVADGIASGEQWWVDDLAAHPADPSFFRRWFADAARWGATCIEQDWMLMYWFGVRALRSTPGRALAWQGALNAAGDEFGVDLLWCMATPADLIEAVRFERVAAVRTCDDYRFADDPAVLWTWFLTVNRLADVLGLTPFKDCFFSGPPGDDPIDGDRHAELEALLSALSTGPVGIGDRLGRTDRDVVLRTCLDDGTILRPDRPIGLVDDCLFGAPARGERLAWATTTSTVATTAGDRTWTYVVAINTAGDRRAISDHLELDTEHHLYEWRTGSGHVGRRLAITLGPRDWALFVCCPLADDGSWTVGDPTKYVTAHPHAFASRSA